MNETKIFFQKLIDYHHHHNERFIQHCKTHIDALTPEILETLNHSVAAQVLWNQRILGDNNLDPNLWTNRDLSTIEDWESKHYKIACQILNENELNKEIHFTGSQGKQHMRSLEQILFHVLNHYTYHRGQLILQFKKAGLETISSDYIMYDV